MNDYYVCIPIDSSRDCRLKFVNDTTVGLSTIRRHMSGGLSMTFKFQNSDTAIDIITNLSGQDSFALNTYRITYFLKPIIHLVKIDGGFIDYSKSLIYVRQKDFSDNPDITYIIDGKTFKQKTGKTDGYGLIKKSPKTNKSLQRRLKKLDKDNCSMELVRGLNAYNRFGLKSVYGTIIITTKK